MRHGPSGENQTDDGSIPQRSNADVLGGQPLAQRHQLLTGQVSKALREPRIEPDRLTAAVVQLFSQSKIFMQALRKSGRTLILSALDHP